MAASCGLPALSRASSMAMWPPAECPDNMMGKGPGALPRACAATGPIAALAASTSGPSDTLGQSG
ncbi:hypothetical protein D9M69_608240 [compost metagenome]